MKKKQEEQEIEDPKLLRTSADETWVLDPKTGELLIHREEITRKFHPVLRRWIDTDTKESYRKPEERGYVKSVKFSILVVRRTTDPVSLKPTEGYFHRVIKGEIPELKRAKNWFLKISPSQFFKKEFRSGGIVFCRGVEDSQELSPNDSEIFSTISEKRVTKKEAIKLVEDAAVLKILEEDYSGRLTECVLFYRM
jgi:hypothetical protein